MSSVVCEADRHVAKLQTHREQIDGETKSTVFAQSRQKIQVNSLIIQFPYPENVSQFNDERMKSLALQCSIRGEVTKGDAIFVVLRSHDNAMRLLGLERHTVDGKPGNLFMYCDMNKT